MRWLELVKDYDYDISYHLGQANVVIDALSRKVVLSHILIYLELQQELVSEQIELVIRLMARLQI